MKQLVNLFFLFCISSFSQSTFVEGTITTNDSIQHFGQIKFESWTQNPEKIEFKSDNVSKKYSPKDILAFTIEDSKYKSEFITLDVSSQIVQTMKKGEEPKFEQKHVFLKVLVEGEGSLYEYYDNRSHFFIKINDEISELINRKFLADVDEELLTNKRTKILVYEKYIGQLKLYFSNCESLNITKLEYNKSQLQKLFNEYNKCIGKGSDYSASLDKSKVDFYITAGISYSNLNIKYSSGLLNGLGDQSVFRPTFGGALNFRQDRSNWSFYMELTYNSFNKETEFIHPVSSGSGNNLTTEILDLKSSSIRFLPMLRYKFNNLNSDFVAFINAGPGMNFTLNGSSDLVQIRETTPLTYYYDVYNFKKIYYQFSVGTGFEYNNFSSELRFNLTTNNSNTSYSKSTINDLSLILAYRFNPKK